MQLPKTVAQVRVINVTDGGRVPADDDNKRSLFLFVIEISELCAEDRWQEGSSPGSVRPVSPIYLEKFAFALVVFLLLLFP